LRDQQDRRGIALAEGTDLEQALVIGVTDLFDIVRGAEVVA
jgi:hypothetical protein